MGSRYIKGAKDIRDIVLIIVLGVVIVIALFNAVPIKSRIDVTYAGVVWEFGNPDFYAETEVRINGEYTRYLFYLFHEGDSFNGKIEISTEDYTGDGLMLPVTFSNKQYELSNIVYLDGEGGDCRILSIAAAPMLAEGVFLLGNGSGDQQVAVSFPSTSREQAVSCAQKLFHEDFNID